LVTYAHAGGSSLRHLQRGAPDAKCSEVVVEVEVEVEVVVGASQVTREWEAADKGHDVGLRTDDRFVSEEGVPFPQK
jgi:hypothetical protein